MARRTGRALCFSLGLMLGLSAATTTLTAMAQPAGFKPAGNYAETSMLASLFYTAPDNSQSVELFLSRQVVVATPPADPSLSSDETSGFVFVQSPNINCSINDNTGGFNVTSDVQSATLQMTIPQANCSGFGVTSDIAVDITWTGAGPIQSTNSATQFSCAGYTDQTQGTDTNNAGPATFDITGLEAPITVSNPQTFHFGSSIEHAQGAVPPNSCNGSVPGKGGPPARPAAGNYHATVQAASTFAFPSDGGFLMLDARRNASTSSPLGGVSTSSAETDVTVSAFTSTLSVGGCFAIDPGGFVVSSPSAAALNTSLTSGPNNGCGGGPTSISPDPFQINASWTGTSPVATTRSNSQFTCLRYHLQVSSVQVVVSVADVAVSMPGLDGVFPASSSLGSSDTRTHADGTLAPGCSFRG